MEGALIIDIHLDHSIIRRCPFSFHLQRLGSAFFSCRGKSTTYCPLLFLSPMCLVRHWIKRDAFHFEFLIKKKNVWLFSNEHTFFF